MREILRAIKRKVKGKVHKPYRRVIQAHHITYDPPWIVRVYKGEHFICTQLQRRTHVSKGFITQLKIWIAEHETRAIDLGEFKGKEAENYMLSKEEAKKKQKKVVDRGKSSKS